jgi:hypothetical protein
MSDDADTLGLSPYLGGLDAVRAAAVDGLGAVAGPALRYLSPFDFPHPRLALDGPGYLVIHRGELAPGAPVAIGTMPRGLAGGVDEWTAGTIAEADGMAAPTTGEPGWYVPEGAERCPRCKDQNWDHRRRCITCTDGDDGYADGAFAAGWSAEAADRARRAPGA